jgi:hypothetical protein
VEKLDDLKLAQSHSHCNQEINANNNNDANERKNDSLTSNA